MGHTKRILLLVAGLLLLSQSVYATNYKMKFNAQTGRGDWVVDDSSLGGTGDFLADGTVPMTAALPLYSAESPTTDAAGECAFDSNAQAAGRGSTQCYDGTACTYLTGVLCSDLPENGQVRKWNTGGFETWENDNDSAGITVADTQVLFSDGADNPTGDAGMTYNKTTDTLSVGSVVTAPSATPTSAQYDSDTTDVEISTQQVTECTEGGTTVEDCDYTMSSKVNGDMTAFITRDASVPSTAIANLVATNAGLTTPTITTSLTANSLTISEAELGYLDGVTSAVQTQLGTKPNSVCKTIETPADADNIFAHYFTSAATISSIYCIVEAATSAVITVQECDVAGDNCAGIDGATTVTCDVGGQTDDGALSNAAVDATDTLRIDVGTVTGSVGQVMVCINF